MNATPTSAVTRKNYNIGYLVSLFGTVLILLWIGLLKFTPTEANGIKPLIENHPLSFWMYKVFSIQMVSNIVGTVEFIVAILLLLSLKFQQVKKYAGIGMCIIFVMTLSYLFTTPNMWKEMDGIPTTDFFILKDIMLLGFGISLLEKNKS
ncbi:DUF417 family protein [Sphingobacterium sp. MYb382]|uniref:DUF417 family protein n=1 Tax=Sphingobacterium sp. MYb382 TaxID=2745278 RepID=UPI0030A7F9C6